MVWWNSETTTITFRGTRSSDTKSPPHRSWISIRHNKSGDTAWHTLLPCPKIIEESRVAGFPDIDWSSHKARISDGAREDRLIPLLPLHLWARHKNLILLSHSRKHDSGCFSWYLQASAYVCRHQVGDALHILFRLRQCLSRQSELFSTAGRRLE
jgi:hypothetical protein